MTASGFLTLESVHPYSWLELIKKCDSYDVYHLPFYHSLSRSLGEGEPVLFYFQENEHVICLPLLLRPVDLVDGLRDLGHGFKDATSVYGYVGPAMTGREIPNDIVKNFQNALLAGLREMNVVDVFTRLHPVLQNQFILHGLGDCNQEGYTVSIDTSLPLDEQCRQYRRNHKVNIKKLHELGISCRETNARGDISAFIEIYDQAMKRVGAPSSYFFPPSWYEGFLRSDEAVTRLFLCEMEGKPICGGLIAMCEGFVELHLAGVANDYVRLSPLKLLFDAVRTWSVEHGGRVLHLGGGIGAKADSLYEFKSGFSRRRHMFQTWRWILDQSTYDRLVEAKTAFERTNRISTLEGFFPKYRTPVIMQKLPLDSTEVDAVVTYQGRPQAEAKGESKEVQAGKLETGNHNVTIRSMEDRSSTPRYVQQGSRLRILILGGGGHARVIADAILTRAAKHEGLDVVGFLDDDPLLLNKHILGKLVLGKLSDLRNNPHDAVVVGIGDNDIRRRLFDELSRQGENHATVIHPRATVARDVKLGRGTVVFAGVVVNTGSKIGDNVILNTGCTIDHECEIKSHSHICPGAHLGGTVRIGEGAFIGIGSTILHNKSVGDWAVVGGGGVVIRDVPPRTTVVGVPAKALAKK